MKKNILICFLLLYGSIASADYNVIYDTVTSRISWGYMSVDAQKANPDRYKIVRVPENSVLLKEKNTHLKISNGVLMKKTTAEIETMEKEEKVDLEKQQILKLQNPPVMDGLVNWFKFDDASAPEESYSWKNSIGTAELNVHSDTVFPRVPGMYNSKLAAAPDANNLFATSMYSRYSGDPGAIDVNLPQFSFGLRISSIVGNAKYGAGPLYPIISYNYASEIDFALRYDADNKTGVYATVGRQDTLVIPQDILESVPPDQFIGVQVVFDSSLPSAQRITVYAKIGEDLMISSAVRTERETFGDTGEWISIGADGESINSLLAFTIDDFKTYDRALSYQEILQNFNANPQGSTSFPLALKKSIEKVTDDLENLRATFSVSTTSVYVSSWLAKANARTLTSGQGLDIVSISLPSGTWHIGGSVVYSGGAITGTGYSAFFSTVAGNNTIGYDDVKNAKAGVVSPRLGLDIIETMPIYRVTLTTDTRYYLKTSAIFTIGAQTASGGIWAEKKQ